MLWIFGSQAKYHKTVRNPPTCKYCIFRYIVKKKISNIDIKKLGLWPLLI